MTAADGALEVFRQIYETDHWKGGSGEGSHVGATDVYRELLTAVLAAADVRSVVDAGCGDWQFSRLVDWSGRRYLGVDIVPELVDANRSAYGRPGVDFVAADIRTERLPRADLLLCKDVLQHWDVRSIGAFLDRNLARYRYALVTNDVASVHSATGASNSEIAIGHWRPVDLERAPFSRRAQWRFDFDIVGEWTKRTVLYVRARDRVLARARRGSAYRICRAYAPR